MKMTSLMGVAAGILIAGCSTGRAHVEGPSAPRTPASQAAPPPARVEAGSAGAKHELDTAPAAKVKPIVAVTRADWCAACRRIEPVVKYMEEEFRGRATFVYLDLTTEDTAARAARQAAEMGIEGFFEANAGRTGVVAVFGRDRRLPTRVRSRQTGPYREAIEEAERSFNEPEDSRERRP